MMTTGSGTLPVRSEARGPHWVAWIPGTDGKPEGSVLVVGRTREDAEEQLRRWAAQFGTRYLR
jgi:hypothetical protein